MPKKKADLEDFQVPQPTGTAVDDRRTAGKRRPGSRGAPATARLKKGFLVRPEAARQFDILVAERKFETGQSTGPRLIDEALNLLFAKYGKPPV